MPKSRKTPYHAGRVNEDIARELSVILSTVKDPRVAQSFLTVTGCETTADLKYCKIYYSHLTGDEKDVKTGLYSAVGYIRRELAQRLSLRQTPELTFVRDTGLAHGAKISELLKRIDSEKPRADEGEAEDNP